MQVFYSIFFYFVCLLVFSNCLYPSEDDPSFVVIKEKKSKPEEKIRRSGAVVDQVSRSNTGGTIPNINRLEPVLATPFDVENFFDSVVSIYSVQGTCDTHVSRLAHKACVFLCIRGSSGVRDCAKGCNTVHSCTLSGIIGSGVFASRTTVLTNEHVIRIKPNSYHIKTTIENQFGNKTTQKAIKWYDKDDDVALIELNASLPGVDVPSFGSHSSLKVLERVFTIGNPKGVRFVASLGYITKKNQTSDDCGSKTNCILYSIPIGGGNSGGPVFDYQGRLVGLIAFGYDGYDNLNGGPLI